MNGGRIINKTGAQRKAEVRDRNRESCVGFYAVPMPGVIPSETWPYHCGIPWDSPISWCIIRPFFLPIPNNFFFLCWLEIFLLVATNKIHEGNDFSVLYPVPRIVPGILRNKYSTNICETYKIRNLNQGGRNRVRILLSSAIFSIFMQ